MKSRRKYQKRETEFITAVQVNLDLKAFTYRKWGHLQRCKRGDWLVDNDGEVYTIDRKTFVRTYRRVKKGTYVKSAPVWAEVASVPGKVSTKEGVTHYKKGDYLVYNNANGSDPYAVARRDFKRMYKPAE